MDAAENILRDKLAATPDDAALKDTLARLQTLRATLQHGAPTDDAAVRLTDELQVRFETLQRQGLWDTEGKEADVLRSLNAQRQALQQTDPSRISVVRPPSPSSVTRVVYNPWARITRLPPEIAGRLNEVYFLHLLATSPEQVIPPGKSLLSMLSQQGAPSSASPGAVPDLEVKVKEIVHKAFWDEVHAQHPLT